MASPQSPASDLEARSQSEAGPRAATPDAGLHGLDASLDDATQPVTSSSAEASPVKSSNSGSNGAIATSTPVAAASRPHRGHTRQRSLSCSDTLSLGAETPERAPLFVGRAPHESRGSAGHSYTPAKPVLPKSESIASGIAAGPPEPAKPAPVKEGLVTLLNLSPALSKLRSKSTSGESGETKPGLRETEPIKAERAQISAIFNQLTCYDMIPDSGKIVVLDTKLKVKKAFAALVHHGIRAAVLWDSSSQQYVGMITVSDFINILRKYYVSPLVKIEELEDHQIQTWRDITAADKTRPLTLVCIDPNASLYDAVQTLRTSRVHRLPVIDTHTGNALYIATLSKILRYVRQAVAWDMCPKLMSSSVKDLQIGTVKNVAAVSEDTPLISVLNVFSERRISALPVISSEGTVIDIYVKTDAIMLARDRSYNNLDVPVSAALKARHAQFDGVQTCLLEDTLEQVLDRMVENDLHRLIIVDQHKRLIGVLSLSDILSLFIA
eukprot:m.455842 g.455842  ORF g.455842 m.455842 type:complete len:496 (-) comp20943_c0_seq1:184-1671(-)